MQVAFDAVSGAVTGILGGGEETVNRKAIQAAAEKQIPSDVRRAVVKEVGELPATPETAEVATRDYETARSQREHRNSIRRFASRLPFIDLAEEAPSAVELYQKSIAETMQRSEAAGPQIPGERAQSMAKNGAAGAADATPNFEFAGRDGAAGYARGLMSGGPEASKAGADVAMSALDGLSSPAGQDSHSPSRKFARLGGDAVDGYVEAIEEGAPAAARAGRGLGRAGLDGLPEDRAAGARFTDASLEVPLFSPAAAEPPQISAAARAPVERKIEINVTVPINMPAGARTREVDDMISKLRAMLPGTLQAAVEALAIEGGV